MHLLMVGTSAPSHISPGLAVIAELVRRGHRVTYAVGQRHADLVEPTGAEVLAHPTVLPGTDETWPEDTGEAMQIFLDEAVAVAPLLETADRPDAVLYDIGGFAGRLQAEVWGVPALQLSPTWVAWEGMAEEAAEHTAALRASPSGQRYFAQLREWLDAHGLATDADEFVGAPERCVALIPRELQPHADRVPDRYVFTGPCIDPSRTEGWTPEPGDDRPLVYVCLGTSYTDREDIYRLCLDHLADDHRLVLATGKVDPARLEPLPPGTRARRTQPQLDVLAHADVFVTHAGMGGAAESLWYGVPTVALPQAVDQFRNAESLERLGVGVRLPDDELTGPRLYQAVREALARTVPALELQEEVRAVGGAGNAADAVERLLG